jgi:protein-tyrosine phosphatase
MAAPAPTLKLIYLCTSNVCRSPIAEAIAADLIEARGLTGRVAVSSRGLTDSYSAWGHPAEPRMTVSAKKYNLSQFVLDRLAAHGSTEVAPADATGDDTVMFLVTSHHFDWTRQAIGEPAFRAAKAEGRLRLIDSKGGDVADPFFGGQEQYDMVCAHLLTEIPATLDAVLRERGVLAAGDAPLRTAALGGDAASKGREFGAQQGGVYAPKK